jgi:hypothetical protein
VNFLKLRSFWQATFWLSSATLANFLRLCLSAATLAIFCLSIFRHSANLLHHSANLLPLCKSSANLLRHSANLLLQFCQSTVATLPIFCRHYANLLPPLCQSSAAILPIFCRHSANLLPPCRRCSAMLPILSRSSDLMLLC